jgi:hypothetical protein
MNKIRRFVMRILTALGSVLATPAVAARVPIKLHGLDTKTPPPASNASAVPDRLRQPESFPVIDSISVANRPDPAVIESMPERAASLSDTWEPALQLAERLKRAHSRGDRVSLRQAATWLHEWSKRYPVKELSPALKRTVPLQLERLRSASSILAQAANGPQSIHCNRAVARLLSEFGRLAKLHRRELPDHCDEIDCLMANHPEVHSHHRSSR